MIGLIQRVSSAQVTVGNKTTGTIGNGLLALIGVQKEDTEAKADRLLERMLTYRLFADDDGKMNLSLRDVGGGLLLVPQFTLAADTRNGSRPGFSTAAPPAVGKQLFNYLLQCATTHHTTVAAGVFAADMQVSLVNNGPVTFWLES